MPAAHVALHVVDGEHAAGHLAELRDLYTEVYAESPYEWGDDHARSGR